MSLKQYTSRFCVVLRVRSVLFAARIALGTLFALSMAGWSSAQLPDVTQLDAGGESPQTMFPHSVDSRFWVSGQMNFVYQANPAFSARYSGKNSFGPEAESATGRVLTLYTGLQLNRSTEVLFDVEEAGGLGTTETKRETKRGIECCVT